jgi:DnaJ homolog subfamily C member 28
LVCDSVEEVRSKEAAMPDKTDDQIRRAMEEGHFDNLSGKGKPLDLKENPFEDPEWRMAHHMLREAGFSLPWIEARREIEAEIESARRKLRQSWEKRQTALLQKANAFERETDWKTAQHQFREKVEFINKLIRDYNLQAPLLQVQMLMLKSDREIEKVAGQNGPSGTI